MFANGTGRSTFLGFLILFTTFTASAGSAHEAPWQHGNELFDGCIFDRQSSLGLSDLSAEYSFGHVSQTELLVESLHDALCFAAKQASHGIALSHEVVGSVKRNLDKLVDLDALVQQSIDSQAMDADPYWLYYCDCDRWGVAFCDRVAPLSVTISESRKMSIASMLADRWRSAEHRIRELEFAIIERVGPAINACAIFEMDSRVLMHTIPVAEQTSEPGVTVGTLLMHGMKRCPLVEHLIEIREYVDQRLSTLNQWIHATQDNVLNISKSVIDSTTFR